MPNRERPARGRDRPLPVPAPTGAEAASPNSIPSTSPRSPTCSRDEHAHDQVRAGPRSARAECVAGVLRDLAADPAGPRGPAEGGRGAERQRLQRSAAALGGSRTDTDDERPGQEARVLTLPAQLPD